MKILMTTLFDPDRRDGITSHESSIVSSLVRKDPIDEAVVLTKADKGNINLPAALAQFGRARLSIFHERRTMTFASIRLLLLYLLGRSGLKFPTRSSIILLGYHWAFWLPFLRSGRTIVFVPFDCWSARELRVAADETSFIRKYGRRIFGLVIRMFEHSSARYVDLFGFVSREEIDKYIQGLNSALRARVLSRAAILPMVEYSELKMNREILAGEISRVLIWMDGRVGYGVKSIAAASRALERWMLRDKQKNITVTLLTRRSDAEMRDILSSASKWNNIEFFEGDLPSFLGTFDIIILPDLNGSGLKNRAVQSIGSGASVVATSIAAEGLSGELKAAIHVIGTHDELGESLDRIFADIEGARKMACAARGLLALESQETGERAEFLNKVVLSITAD